MTNIYSVTPNTVAFKGGDLKSAKKLIQAYKSMKCPYSGEVIPPAKATTERVAQLGITSTKLSEEKTSMLKDYVKSIEKRLAENPNDTSLRALYQRLASLI